MIKTGMPSTKISAASFGDARPLVANDTPSNKKQNRRIEIVVLPDIESLPGYE
jgi:chemotaxis protein MotB